MTRKEILRLFESIKGSLGGHGLYSDGAEKEAKRMIREWDGVSDPFPILLSLAQFAHALGQDFEKRNTNKGG